MALDRGERVEAVAVLSACYPFVPITAVARRYSPRQSLEVFRRDGFIDRYSGRRLVFPGMLRLLSVLLPNEFPFHPNWKADACHFAYYELFPTIDHVVPVSRGGSDSFENWVSTSMMRNAAKANWTLDELGWELKAPGDLREWNGLTSWFSERIEAHPNLLTDAYLNRWQAAIRDRRF